MIFKQVFYTFLYLGIALSMYLLSAIGWVIRIFVGIYLQWKYNQVIQFPTSGDAFFMFDKNYNHYEILANITVKGKFDLNVLKQLVDKHWLQPRQENGQWIHMKLRQCLHLELGYFFWRMKKNFCIDDHFYCHETVVKNVDEFYCILKDELSTPLPRDRPLWYFKIVHLSENFPGLETGSHSCILFKFHHCLADGVGMIRMFNSGILDQQTDELSPVNKNKKKIPFTTRLYNLAKTIFDGCWLFVDDMFTHDKNVFTDLKLTGKKLAGITEPISISRIKKLKNVTKTTINDILTSCVCGALREFIIQKNGDITKSIRFFFPVFVSDMSEAPGFYNKTSAMFYNFAVQESSSMKRLMLTKQRMDHLKQTVQFYYNFYTAVICSSYIPYFFMSLILDIPKISGLFSNIPGPQRTVYIRGQLVKRINVCFSIGLDIGLVIAALSYKEIVQISLTVDTSLIKTQEEVCQFVKNINNEFEKLENEVSRLNM